VRFQAKFGLGDLWVFSLGCLYLCVWAGSRLLRSSRSWSTVDELTCGLLILAALQLALGRFFLYWEMDSAGLRERRYWNTTDVAWVEVKHVGSFPSNSPASDTLVVDYVRGRIVAKPEDRLGFISTLRRYAPQATFDV